MRVVHIAGLDVTIHGVFRRQRCAWCGAVQIDEDLSRVAVPVGQKPPGAWGVGELVSVEGDNPKVSSVVEYIDKLPPDCCAMLDPEVTR